MYFAKSAAGTFTRSATYSTAADGTSSSRDALPVTAAGEVLKTALRERHAVRTVV
ncbi:hypothetical protein AB0I82_11930 [Streptomyces sp. NPDC050315]|uniref:hypothetical protein n=1 Tax=Streptomyces sp. NPDC050315 TaxID=3155039 RepID=UPI003439364B